MIERIKLAIQRPDLLLRRIYVGSSEFTRISFFEISKHMRGGGFILEAGFSDGVDTELLLDAFPKHVLIAIEPVFEQYEYVKKRIFGKVNLRLQIGRAHV